MRSTFFRYLKITVLALVVIFLCGFMVPENFSMPVEGATRKSYSQQSFWAYPWGRSVTHKGVDIFARRGTNVRSATAGIVLFSGVNKIGGNVVLVLGPKWRIHYYAHLDSIKAGRFSILSRDEVIGTVGTTGNAVGKPPHLHYTIRSVIPYPWRRDNSIQGWKKMYYLNPITYLNSCK
ncbi:MAG TPA: M23 family metallopeptidase [Flavisolibacter sp.]